MFKGIFLLVFPSLWCFDSCFTSARFFYSEYELNETVRINGKNDDDNFRSTFSYEGIFLTNQACVFCFPEHVVWIGETKHTSYKKGLSISTTLV